MNEPDPRKQLSRAVLYSLIAAIGIIPSLFSIVLDITILGLVAK